MGQDYIILHCDLSKLHALYCTSRRLVMNIVLDTFGVENDALGSGPCVEVLCLERWPVFS